MRVEFGERKECLGQIDMRIETYSLLINSSPCNADAYNFSVVLIARKASLSVTVDKVLR